jgi:predicted Zn finger-like uncharacterized protein
MKIVCDACQAKYSIADDKIQGKSFKIRCKKCNHIIVVKVSADGAVSGAAVADRPRTTGSHAAAGASSAAAADKPRASGGRAVVPAPAPEQAVWHVVVDGEQVGPLTESEIKDRLRQGKVNSDTLVWKEGFGDWTQFSAVPELTPLLARITHHPVASKPAAREPARAATSAKPVAAALAASAAEADPFAAPTVISPAGTADLFASAMGGAPAAPTPAPTSPFLFGGGGPAQPAEPVVARSSGGNGAGTTHLTGQRNENSVLFSLANLEALAVPAQSGNVRSPSASSNTEGSGLIDIRSMAAMTLSDGSSGDNRRSADALPTFSTPQFSPVAPVLLPMSTSGPPKWVYPVLVLLGIAILAVGISIYQVAIQPPPGLAPPPPPPVAAPPAAAAPAPAVPAAGEVAKPAGPEEKPAPPAAGEKAPDKAKSASGKGDKGRRKGGDQSGSGKGAAEAKKGGETTATTPTQPTEGGTKRTDKKGKQSLDDLLGEVGSKKTGGGDDSAPKPVVKLITLTQSDIVSAMKGVQPKVQACANQFKAPGTAMANIGVAAGGRVSSATVTGKFAGTPSGSCVETAAKSAKFPPCQAMSFPWPFTLSPR